MTSGQSPVDSASNASEPARRVAVIGGGITGLAAAQRLISVDDQIQVTVFEGSDTPGGMIRTESRDGYLMELGPDSFITNKPGGVQLCEEIGFSDQLIPTDNAFRRSLVLRNRKPLPVPDGFMLMAPAKPLAIATTKVLSLRGKLRLLSERFQARQQVLDDESLAGFVRRRFGKETLERLVQPLVGGIYTSDPEKLSLQATLPRFLEMERAYGSVIKATLAEQRRKSSKADDTAGSGARYGLFVTPQQGLTSLVDAVAGSLRQSGRVDLRTSAAVHRVARDGHGWQVALENGPRESFDAVIVTLPTRIAAGLLADAEFTELADSLRQIEYASSAIVVTGHRLADFQHPLDAFGLVIPHIEQRRILAVSFTSRKFPGRAPASHVLLRTFVGGAMQPELLQRDDGQLTALVHEELRDLLGMQRTPEFSQVVRYNNAMPQYHVGHVSRVDRIESLTAQYPGLFLAGNAYRGVGLPDSIASGRTAAERAVTCLAEPR